MQGQNGNGQHDNHSGSRIRRVVIVVLLIALIILILLLLRKCVASLDPFHTGSDVITDNHLGGVTDHGGIETDPHETTRPPIGGDDTTKAEDTTDEPDDPYNPPDTSAPEETTEPEDKEDIGSTPSDTDVTKPSDPPGTTASKEITLNKFFGFDIDGKDEFITEDWTPGSRETIGYKISGKYNKDRTLYFTLNINSDVTPSDDHLNGTSALADVLHITIKYYDFDRTEENKHLPPVFTKSGTFTEIAALGAIEIGTLYKEKDGTCELDVVMDTGSGNEYSFAKLDAEFLWSAE